MASSVDARDDGGGDSSRAREKRAANVPITAGAFGFHFGTPAAKKPKPRVGVPRQEQSTPAESTPRVQKTPMTKVLHALDALPSPLQFQRNTTPRPGPTGKHKLNSVLDEISPFRSGPPSRLKDGGVSLGQLPGAESMSGELAKRKREDQVKEMEEDGVGVSPRRNKDARLAGKGPMPLGPQLVSLLRGTESSLILFYSSLQRRLAPPRSPAKATRHHGPDTHSVAASPLTIAQTATLIVRPQAVIHEPTHQAIMVECQLDTHHRRASHGAGEAADAEMEPDNREGEGEAGAELEPALVVVFQNIPSGCPRVGGDARVMAGKMKEADGRGWDGVVGIWSPWTERRIHLDDNDRQTDAVVADGREAETAPRVVRIIFASRYLIVDSRQTTAAA